MFNFIKNTLSKIYEQVSSQLHSLFSATTIDEQTLKELEILLLKADTGIKTSKTIIANLRSKLQQGTLHTGIDLQQELQKELLALLNSYPASAQADVYLLIGINGSGKTTFAAKLARHLTAADNKILLVAGDTFRAAAVEQLSIWAERTNTPLIKGTPNQDPAAVVFLGCQEFQKSGYKNLIIDTAGRLQSKTNLMQELAKIKRIIEKQLPSAKICTLLTIDAMLGQNSFDQAKLFNECTKVDGIVVTKIDGTGKGGIVFSIVQELHIPIMYLSYGEQLEQIKKFNALEYVQELITQH